MSVSIVPRLQIVPLPISGALAALPGAPGAAPPPARTLLAPWAPQTLRLQRNDTLLLPPSTAGIVTQPVPTPAAESALPPWLGALGQAAAREALAGLDEPEGAEVHTGAQGTLPAQRTAARPDASVAGAQPAATQGPGDVTHPPTPPATIAQTPGETPPAKASVATPQAAQQAAATTVGAQLHEVDDALTLGWNSSAASTLARPQLPRELASWLSLMQRPQPAHLLLKVQEQLVMPMLARQRLRIGGVLGSDIDSSHETEGARAAPLNDVVLGVTELPQQRLEGYDLRQPMRLFYDLLSKRRRARQKLTRI